MANGFPNADPRTSLWPFLHWLFDTNGGGNPGFTGNYWFVNAAENAVGGDGSASNGFATMAQAFAKVQSGDVIFAKGNIREQLSTPVGIFDVTVVGLGTVPRNADAFSGYNAQTTCTWRGPASPAAATPLVTVLQQGWSFQNILFNSPTDAAAVSLFRNAGAGNLERDASHASIIGCRFDGGGFGLQSDGGVFNVRVQGCQFYRITDGTGVAIRSASVAIALPLDWQILDNIFMLNDNHVILPLVGSTIKNNTFSAVAVTTKLSLTGGTAGNWVVNNALGGTYSVAGGYVSAGASDEWGGNYNSIAGGVTAANPA